MSEPTCKTCQHFKAPMTCDNMAAMVEAGWLLSVIVATGPDNCCKLHTPKEKPA
jgi:hypothetical protein